MRWKKLGRVYCPDGSLSWAKKYAFPPNPVVMSEDTLRIYLSFCDNDVVGRAGYVDLDPNDPTKVKRVSKRPILDIGKPGRFDENGVLPTTVMRVGDEYYMYYVGYQLGQKLRYYQFEGLAISRDGETFERAREVPVLDRSHSECVNRTSAFVQKENGKFQMWYVGGSDWISNGKDNKSLPVYNIKYVESANGIDWPQEGEVVIDYKDADEHALGRPWIFKDGDKHKMYFSSRTYTKGYRLGLAESSDGGKTWVRKDESVGIDVSPDGWDSEMIAYASVFEWKGNRYLFYNGNNCGQTGFGVAIMENN